MTQPESIVRRGSSDISSRRNRYRAERRMHYMVRWRGKVEKEQCQLLTQGFKGMSISKHEFNR